MGRPGQAIIEATDLHVLTVHPGSIRIGLRPPAAFDQDELFPREPTTLETVSSRAIDRLLRMAMWASSNRIEPPLDEFPDRDEAALVARHLANLAPGPKGAVRTVTFEGAMIPSEEPIRMQPEARPRLIGLEQLLSHIEEQTVYGVIREIDLDARRIILRERGPGMIDLRCSLPAKLVAKAERLLDHNVEVKGLISSTSPDTVQVIDLRENKQ